MRKTHLATRLGAIALALALPSAALAATTTVTFVNPDRFTDAGGRGGFADVPTKQVVLSEVRSHLVALGERQLPATQTLTIEILDIDIAGRRDVMGLGVEDVRVHDNLTSPRIRLRFVLEEDGRVVKRGEDRLADPAYLNSFTRTASGDPLRYERPMLTKWFNARFGSGS